MDKIPSTITTGCDNKITRPLRVLHVYKTSWPEYFGGIEQSIRQLCQHNKTAGPTDANHIQNFVFSLTYKSTTRQIAHTGHTGIIRYPVNLEISSTCMSWRALLEFGSIAQRMDVIHYHFPWPFGDLLHLVHATDKPSIVTYHSDIIRQQRLLKLYKPVLYRFLGSVDRIVATSPNYLESSQTLTRFRDKVSIIPLGLNEDTYPDVHEQRMDKWRAILGEGFFLFVGVLRYYKGLHQLLDASMNSNKRVVIVGAGPMESELQPRLLNPELANVHLMGGLDDKDKVALIKLCRALVFPSHLRSEAFGLSLLEAAMLGKPMISSEIGTGTTYINIHNETGIVVPPDDADALRNAMHYLDENPETAEAMGKKARKRFLKLFTSEKMREAYAKEYYELSSVR